MDWREDIPDLPDKVVEMVSGELIDNYYIGYDAKIVLIPEPATLLLLGLGAVMLGRKR